jgi:parallel beta-helix repeat protein
MYSKDMRGQEDIKMVNLITSRPSQAIPLLIIIVLLCPFACGKVIYVSKDSQADFDKIQAGIEAADYNDTVSVAPGTYFENIILKDGIILSGAGADVTIIDANGYGDVVDARANDAVISGFTLRNSGQFDLEHTNCGVYVDGSYAPIIKNNVITHNRNGIGLWYGANPYISNNIIKNNNNGFYIYGSEENPSNPSIINNTIVNNQTSGITLRVMVSPVITNNIIVGHSTGINHNYVTGTPTISYNNLWHNDVNYLRDNSVDDTLAGPGSISFEPYFARSGRWVDVNDPNLAAEPDDPNAVWIDGDYHLKSQTGRWDPNSQSWVLDDITSSCIDAGDPNSPIGSEPLPNGGVINLGDYGSTDEASKSPSGTSIYTFVSEQSTIIQSVGIAGIRRTYTLAGQFRLTINCGARKAWFSNVEAMGTDESAPDRKLDPNEVFNLTALTETIDPNGSVRFTGQTADESEVVLDLTIFHELIYLKGETIPPPDSADYFIFNLDAVAKRKYGGGTGEPNNPYLIYTAEQMNQIGLHEEDWDKHFKLMEDIDLSAFAGEDFNIISYWRSWDDYKPFTGAFDGNGHIIANFTYTSEEDIENIGLFGYIADANAQIKNVGMVNSNVDVKTEWNAGCLAGCLREGCITGCYVEGGNVKGKNNVGGLAGYNYKGSISKCHSTDMDIEGDGHVGGLIGCNEEGNITTSYSSGSIEARLGRIGGLVGINWCGCITNSYSTGSVNSVGSDVGGFVGFNAGGSIKMSYSTSIVTGNHFVGGLVGYNDRGNITTCYSSNIVTGNENVGGLVGHEYKSSSIMSFWNTETSGQITSAGGTGLTTAEMQTASTFLEAGWDFVDETENGTEDIWWILEGQDYPHLWWENNGN